VPGGPEPWQPAKLYYIAIPREAMQALQEEMVARGLPAPFQRPDRGEEGQAAEGTDEGAGDAEPAEEPTFLQPASAITTTVDVAPYVERKLASFRCHRTQIAPDRFPLSLPPDLLARALGRETFILARSRVASVPPEDDLFAGVR
jgi:LmbE family N-acetylglucosaminyl deacetylase